MSETQPSRQAGGRPRAAAVGGGGTWFVGFVGALVYFIQEDAGSAGLVLLGILKALVWPAFVVYYVLLVGKA
jgi:hypothetical protein